MKVKTGSGTDVGMHIVIEYKVKLGPDFKPLDPSVPEAFWQQTKQQQKHISPS